MKIFYGEKLVREKECLADNKNLIHLSKKLLVLSDKEYAEISLENKDKLIFWGRIFAIVQENGKYLAIDDISSGKKIIKKIFSKSNLNEIIPRIEGDYIACLIKKYDNVVIFADHFNRKDVFYSINGQNAAASSDLSSVVSEGEKSYDQAALANLLSIYGMYAPKKHTIYKNIRRLGVGERLVLTEKKNHIEQIPFRADSTTSYDNSKLTEYFQLFSEAIRVRGSLEGTNWIYLSSGWDSTALLALLVKNFGSSHVRAATCKLEYSDRARDANRFEIERAKKIAKYYSVDISIVPADYTSKDATKKWEKIKPFLRDHHIYADNSYNFYVLSDYIRHHRSLKDTVFCGEISDGAHNLGFSQFTTILEHPVLAFREYSDKMASYLFGPTFFKSILNNTYQKDAVYNLLRSRLKGQVFEDEQPLNEFERKAKFITSFFLRNRRIPFYSIHNNQLLTEHGKELYESEMFTTYLKECAERIEPDTVYSWILYLYNSFHWQGSTVKSISEMTSFNHLRLNLPFWDSRMQEFLSKMPEDWGRGLELRPTKYPLKWMLENKVDYPKNLQVGPHSYLYDVNPNFSLEVEMIYYSALAPHFQKTIKGYPFEKILDKQYFNLDYYRKLTDDYIAGVEESGKKLSDLYNLIWLCWIGWY